MVVIARSLGHFRALLLSYSVALCLILVLCLGNWHFLAVLLWHIVAHFSRDFLLYLFLYSFALFLVLSVTFLLGMTGALLSGNILAVFLWHILALLLGHFVAHLLRLTVTLGRGYN